MHWVQCPPRARTAATRRAALVDEVLATEIRIARHLANVVSKAAPANRVELLFKRSARGVAICAVACHWSRRGRRRRRAAPKGRTAIEIRGKIVREPAAALGLVHARCHARFDQHERVDEVVALHRHVAQKVHVGGGVAVLCKEREGVAAERALAGVLGEKLAAEMVEVRGVQHGAGDAVKVLDLSRNHNISVFTFLMLESDII